MSTALEQLATLYRDQAERRASGKFVSKPDLDKIVVLWRRPDCMSLYGIPYAMREGCGQTPKHLWNARERDLRRPVRSGVYQSKPVDLSDWIWLGQPEWWGSMLPEERAAIEVWLSPLDMLGLVPTGFCEFVDLRKAFGGKTYDQALWGKQEIELVG